MKNYNLTIENGVITWVETTDENGNPIEGILNIPKEATSFSTDAWVALGCDTNGIRVHKDNPVYSSAHNCLLSEDGTKLIKTSKSSDISKLTLIFDMLAGRLEIFPMLILFSKVTWKR